MSGSEPTPSLSVEERGRPAQQSENDEWSRRILLPVGPSDTDRIRPLAATAAETGGMLQAAVHVLHVFRPGRFARVCEQLSYSPDDAPSPTEVARRIKPVFGSTAQRSPDRECEGC